MNFNKEIEHLSKQLPLLEEIIYAIAPRNIGYNELTSVIGPIIKYNYDTAASIKLLAEHNRLRDLIILSRPFIEGVINVGFICAKGDEAVIKSKEYAYQKGYRDLFRELKINQFEIKSPNIDHKSLFENARPDELSEAIGKYTTKGGKEKSSWTEETTRERLEILGRKFGLGTTVYLSFAFFSIYRDVSEIIHGSYYGVRILTGTQQKNMASFSSVDEAAAAFTKHQVELGTLIMQQVNISIAALIEILTIEFKLKDRGITIHERSKLALSEYTSEYKNENKHADADSSNQ